MSHHFDNSTLYPTKSTVKNSINRNTVQIIILTITENANYKLYNREFLTE